MGQAIGDVLALAIGVALSPIPIIAVTLMLTTPLARTNGPAFVLGWLTGLAVVGIVVLALAGPSASDGSDTPAAWTGWLKLALGALLLVVGIRQFLGRPRAGDEVPMPAWMARIDTFNPLTSAGAGAALAAVNPKNLILAVAAATSVAQAGLTGAQQAVAYGVFVLLGTVSVGAPVVIYLVLGQRSADLLGRLKDWMGRHNAVIMSVLCIVISANLVGDAIGVLTA